METIGHYSELLNTLNFTELERALIKMPFEEMEDILYQMAYNPETGDSNLLVYTFMQSMLYKQETSAIHFSLSRLMGSILNHIEFAEQIGLYHGLRALELDAENIDVMEYLLFFNHIPERLLDDSTALGLARKVIKEKPNSKAAMMTLGKLSS